MASLLIAIVHSFKAIHVTLKNKILLSCTVEHDAHTIHLHYCSDDQASESSSTETVQPKRRVSWDVCDARYVFERLQDNYEVYRALEWRRTDA